MKIYRLYVKHLGNTIPVWFVATGGSDMSGQWSDYRGIDFENT